MHTKKKCILTVAGGEKETDTHLKIQKKKKAINPISTKKYICIYLQNFSFFQSLQTCL